MRTKNILIFLPLLAFYIIFVCTTAFDLFLGDEGRYVMFAENLAQGYYSPEADINLWNWPGYPLILLPFVLLKLHMHEKRRVYTEQI